MTDSLPKTEVERAFRDHERALWAHCYRMTGSTADADDVVQDAFARALERPPADLARSLYPWLLRVATNLSMDRLRRRRRTYVGPWLPTPLETNELPAPPAAEPPDARYDRTESLGYAFLAALEALTPQQRAVLLLRDVLGYSVRETAQALETSEGAVKVAMHRARRAMAGYDEARAAMHPVSEPARAAVGRVLERFVDAVGRDDVQALEALLREDVVTVGDGGGVVTAARAPVRGRETVIRFFRRLASMGTVTGMRFTSVNGAPAVVLRYDHDRPGWPTGAMLQLALDGEERIRAIYSVVEPAKLATLGG